MKSRTTIALAGMALALASAAAGAQRGGTVGGDVDPLGRPQMGGTIGQSQITKKQVEKFNPVRVLLDHRKDLAIDDKQREALEQLNDPVKWNITKLAARIDSAQRDMEGGSKGMRFGGQRGGGAQSDDEKQMSPEEHRQRIIAGRAILIAAVAELQRENEMASSDALKVLTDAQRDKATPILRKHNEDLTRILQDAGFVQTGKK